MRWLYPDDGDYFAGDGVVLRFAMRRWLAFGETYTTDDGVALAAFIPPDAPDVAILPEPVEPSPAPDLITRFTALGAQLKAASPSEPHWYLNLLATHPDWQRQGLGEQLMTPIFERCAETGVPLWLETETIANVAYYQRFGFVVASEWDVAIDGPHMWGMLRRW